MMILHEQALLEFLSSLSRTHQALALCHVSGHLLFVVRFAP